MTRIFLRVDRAHDLNVVEIKDLTRNAMTGIFLPIQRADGFHSVEIEDLTEQELGDLSHEKPLDGWRWCFALVRFVRHLRDTSPPRG